MQRLRSGAIAIARILFRRLQRVQLRLAALDCFERAAHFAHFGGQFIHFAAVFAGQRAQFKQARFRRLQRGWIMLQRLRRSLQFLLRFARFNHRAIKRGQCIPQQRVFGRDPV